MFSKHVARTDAFLDMSQSAQNLYFHLGIEADDDGFVSPKMVMRMLGSTDDERIGNSNGLLAPPPLAENLADHLGLGDDGDNPQRPLTAKRTGGHIQGKHPLQEPRPAPARRRCRRLVPLHALLTRRRRDHTAQAAMRHAAGK